MIYALDNIYFSNESCKYNEEILRNILHKDYQYVEDLIMKENDFSLYENDIEELMNFIITKKFEEACKRKLTLNPTLLKISLVDFLLHLFLSYRKILYKNRDNRLRTIMTYLADLNRTTALKILAAMNVDLWLINFELAKEAYSLFENSTNNMDMPFDIHKLTDEERQKIEDYCFTYIVSINHIYKTTQDIEVKPETRQEEMSEMDSIMKPKKKFTFTKPPVLPNRSQAKPISDGQAGHNIDNEGSQQEQKKEKEKKKKIMLKTNTGNS